MSAKKENATILGVGVAACAAYCAGPILGVLAAIGLGTAAGYLLVGTVALLVGAAVIALVVVRRRRRTVDCAPVAVEPARVEFSGTRSRATDDCADRSGSGSVVEESAQLLRMLVSLRVKMSVWMSCPCAWFGRGLSTLLRKRPLLLRSTPTWETEAHPVGDGWLILSGRDMYVNRAMAVGISRAVSDDDIDFVLLRCRQMGVPAAFEVTPSTLPATVERLDRYGFVPDASATVTALVRPIPGPQIDTPDDFAVRRARGENDLALWQEISARGWRHVDRRARDVSDASPQLYTSRTETA